MTTYRIAELDVNMSPVGRTVNQAEKYLTEYTDSPDIQIEISDKVIEKAKAILGYDDLSDAYYFASGFAFYRKLLNFDGFMLHSSAVCTNGRAYLFSGKSGIGKSTHTALWRQLLGDKCYTLNDDKPALRFFEDGSIFAYGTPWSGKFDINENKRVPVGGICFVSRAQDNRIEKLSPKQAAVAIIDQCTKNFNEKEWEKVLSMIDRLILKVPVYRIYCNKDISAAELSYQTLTGEKL